MRWKSYQQGWKKCFALLPVQLGAGYANVSGDYVWLEWVEWRQVPGIYRRYWDEYRTIGGGASRSYNSLVAALYGGGAGGGGAGNVGQEFDSSHGSSGGGVV